MGPLFLVAVFFALGLFVELLSLLFWGSKLASIALLYDMLASMKVIIQKKKFVCTHLRDVKIWLFSAHNIHTSKGVI